MCCLFAILVLYGVSLTHERMWNSRAISTMKLSWVTKYRPRFYGNGHRHNNYNRFRWSGYFKFKSFFGFLPLTTTLAISTLIPVSAKKEKISHNDEYAHFLQTYKRFKPDKPKTVLILDGGGLRGCMSIQILKQLESEIQKLDSNLHVWQVFDLIMGTSTGGLIAIGLGKKQMNCNDIDTFYDQVAERVFLKGAGKMQHFVKNINMGRAIFGSTSGLDTDALESVFQDLVGKDTLMFDKNTHENEPKCAVIATMTNNVDLPNPLLMRNYTFKDLDPSPGFIDFTPQNQFYLAGINIFQSLLRLFYIIVMFVFFDV